MATRPRSARVAEAAGEARSPLTAALIGVVAGGLSGLFGIGGGILIVPALVVAAKLPQRLAHGTSLAATIPMAFGGVVGYAVDGQVEPAAALVLFTGSSVGAILGTTILARVDEMWARLGFSALLVVTAARLMTTPPSSIMTDPSLGGGEFVSLVGIGLVAGIVAGLMGVGGGIVMAPALTVLMGFPVALAKGTSLLVIVPTAAVGTWQNLDRGNVDLRTSCVVGLAGVASAVAASRVSLGLDSRTSSILLALLLLLVAGRLSALGRSRKASGNVAAYAVATPTEVVERRVDRE